jgi:hypothetical protein
MKVSFSDGGGGRPIPDQYLRPDESLQPGEDVAGLNVRLTGTGQSLGADT